MFLVLGNVVSTYLAEQWQSFKDNFGLFAVLFGGLSFVLMKTVENRFNNKLEAYKTEQQTKLESLKLDHQKVMFNFETFSNQQNERYPQMYYLVEHALGHIFSLTGLRRYPDFKNMPKEDVKTYCEKIEMNAGDVNRILSIWENDKDRAQSEIQKLKAIIDYNIAEVKWYDSSDYLIYNELYFSDEVTIQTRLLLTMMNKYRLNLDPQYRDPIYFEDLVQMNKENKVLRTQIEEQRAIWSKVMKKEVSGQRLSG